MHNHVSKTLAFINKQNCARNTHILIIRNVFVLVESILFAVIQTLVVRTKIRNPDLTDFHDYG